MEQTLTRRLAALAMALLLALGAAFAMTGCSDDAQVIRDGISSQLDPLKNPTKENLETLLSEMDGNDLSALEAYGIDIYEFCGHAFRGFDYSVGDISINGDTATADVSITNIDITAAMNAAAEKMQDEGESAKVQELAGDQAALMSYLFGLVYDAMDAETETVTTDTTLSLTKNGNEWSVDEDSMNDLIQAMYGNLAL